MPNLPQWDPSDINTGLFVGQCVSEIIFMKPEICFTELECVLDENCQNEHLFPPQSYIHTLFIHCLDEFLVFVCSKLTFNHSYY